MKQSEVELNMLINMLTLLVQECVSLEYYSAVSMCDMSALSCVDIIITITDLVSDIHEQDDDEEDGIDAGGDTAQCATCDSICNDILSIDKLFSWHASLHDTNISFLLSNRHLYKPCMLEYQSVFCFNMRLDWFFNIWIE